MEIIKASGVAGRERAWTEARVATLKALWLDGFSATKVARQLGGGVTRNAVISTDFDLRSQARRRRPNIYALGHYLVEVERVVAARSRQALRRARP